MLFSSSIKHIVHYIPPVLYGYEFLFRIMKINRKYKYIVSELRHHMIFEKCEIVNLYKIFKKFRKIQTLNINSIGILDGSKYHFKQNSGFNIFSPIYEKNINEIENINKEMLSKLDKNYIKKIKKMVKIMKKYNKNIYNLINKRLADITKINVKIHKTNLHPDVEIYSLVRYMKNIKILKVNISLIYKLVDEIMLLDKLEMLYITYRQPIWSDSRPVIEYFRRKYIKRLDKMKYITFTNSYIWINNFVKDSKWIKKKVNLMNMIEYDIVKNEYGTEYVHK